MVPNPSLPTPSYICERKLRIKYENSFSSFQIHNKTNPINLFKHILVQQRHVKTFTLKIILLLKGLKFLIKRVL